MSENKKKLTKSRKDCKICGVCGGLAEYFGVDSIWIRLAWLILLFCFGTGILLYFAFALIMPEAPKE
ncbi:MAG: PspC domain-containing protein [Clostridia bacterium]|jgi:phage shock protein C|nr:PspC domain-containing protein [Clostridia bacterium]